MALNIPVRTIGRSAARALRGKSAWEVLAVFRRSFYCRAEDGSIVCLGPAGLGAGPLAVLYEAPEALEWDAGLLARGDRARADGRALRVAGRFAFFLEGAAVWRPVRRAAASPPTVLASGLARLAELARGWPSRGGLQSLLPHLAAPGPQDRVSHDPLLDVALPAIARLRCWVEDALQGGPGRLASPCSAAKEFIGLGPGLTPSGDDFIGGAVLALHAFGYPVLAGRLAADAVSSARERTNAISRAHLACAAEGEGAEALHAALDALATPGAPGLGEHLRRIDAIGHTSGWDALAGAVLAAAAMAEHRI